jgi:hypothetical protein
MMAFDNKNMSVIAYANGFTLWHYVSNDNIEKIRKDYFPKRFADLTANGDLMIINAGDCTAIKVIDLSPQTKEITLLDL